MFLNIKVINKSLFLVLFIFIISCNDEESNQPMPTEATLLKKTRPKISKNNKSKYKIKEVNSGDKNTNSKKGSSIKLEEKEETIEVPFSKNYPKNRIMFPGPNYEGLCSNKNCITRKLNQYCWSPMKCFRDLIENGELVKDFKDKLEDNINVEMNLADEMRLACCPICGSYFEHIKAYGLSKSKVKITEIVNNKKEIESIDTSKEPLFFIYRPIIGKIENYRTKKMNIEINLVNDDKN